jgi:hypothetical protein
MEKAIEEISTLKSVVEKLESRLRDAGGRDRVVKDAFYQGVAGAELEPGLDKLYWHNVVDENIPSGPTGVITRSLLQEMSTAVSIYYRCRVTP